MRSVEPTSAAILIVIALLLFAAYQLHVLTSLLVGGSTTIVLPLGVALQGAAAFLAAIGIAGVYGWATVALLVLAGTALATQIYRAFGLGIVPWLDALARALAVILGVMVCVVWLRWRSSRRSPRR